MNVVILGCGRVGSTLARMMYKDGHAVTIIDLQSEAFRRLGAKYKGQRIVGNGIDEDVLRRAGIANADIFVAVSQGDNRNIMAAQMKISHAYSANPPRGSSIFLPENATPTV